MRVAVPRERKIAEGRVALTPQACRALVAAGAEVSLEAGAGDISGFPDSAYAKEGVIIQQNPERLWRDAELIVKVKEPLVEEAERLRPHQILFCYVHLAAAQHLAAPLCASGATVIAFETVVGPRGDLPLLAPMSAIAGRLAGQIGSNLLYSQAGGRGVLLGGVAGTDRGRAVVLGAGQAGMNAAAVLAALGAEITVFDLNPDRLADAMRLGPNVTSLYAYGGAVEEAVVEADLVIGAVLVPGARAPVVVSEDAVRAMRPGAVICDIAIDQGGCVATSRATDYTSPTYRLHEVVHFAVTNMPGAVPRTSTQALSARITPYVLRLFRKDWQQDPELCSGINIGDGAVVHQAVKAALAGHDQSR